jgi:hypothetical protein
MGRVEKLVDQLESETLQDDEKTVEIKKDKTQLSLSSERVWRQLRCRRSKMIQDRSIQGCASIDQHLRYDQKIDHYTKYSSKQLG